jgi:pimeloyl-ACP methyl ester carboxylesterase
VQESANMCSGHRHDKLHDLLIATKIAERSATDELKEAAESDEEAGSFGPPHAVLEFVERSILVSDRTFGLSRRTLLAAALACGVPPTRLASRARGLLSPDRVASVVSAVPEVRAIDGGNVSYVVQGKADGPLLLYFHGWGDDYRVVLPLEYPLVDAGFRILVMHRPGYMGTALEANINRQTADGAARTAAALLNELFGERQMVSVIGMSGGCPTALAFASLYAHRTRRLVLQAGVSRPWTDERYVPPKFRDAYNTAYQQFGWAGDQVSQVIFGSLVAVRESLQKEGQDVAGIVGARLDEAKADPAFAAALACIMRDDKQNVAGELNDARNIFLAKDDYCRWDAVRAPTLVIHDPEDPLVPIVHAQEAARHLKGSRLRPYRLAGHLIYVGKDAQKMHRERVRFLAQSEG